MSKTKKCKPSKYNVITGGGKVTYGFRCGKHKIYSKRYSTQELRDQRVKEHQRSAKKGAK